MTSKKQPPQPTRKRISPAVKVELSKLAFRDNGRADAVLRRFSWQDEEPQQ